MIPGPVIVALICMWINALVGGVLGLLTFDEDPSIALLELTPAIIWAFLAMKVHRRSERARVAAIVLAAVGLMLALAQGRIEFGTNLVILVMLLLPGSRAAFVRRASVSRTGTRSRLRNAR